ncbi:hypothetical protein CJ030_MR3G008343 [Morella rubra]|uniref:Uncharacterized protein n=1 Tax=Morella rubra TaxID=262757 RepID=A0A6A1W8S3_9ROSI|nr:hypothetical protein CJ030_MR3G008343 [Morella rubra]
MSQVLRTGENSAWNTWYKLTSRFIDREFPQQKVFNVFPHGVFVSFVTFATLKILCV